MRLTSFVLPLSRITVLVLLAGKYLKIVISYISLSFQLFMQEANSRRWVQNLILPFAV